MVPCQTGSPGVHGETRWCGLPGRPSAPMKRTAMPSSSRATSSAISSRPSQTARRRSRCTGRPVICPEICRLRSPSTWSIAAPTAASRRAISPSGGRRKALRKFLGDEAGGKLALAPARMVHQRRQERNVVADAVDIERVERGRLRLDRRRARRPVGHELCNHRIVEDRDLAALLHAGVVADGDAVMACSPPAGGISPAGRSRAGNCGTDPRHRRGIPPPIRSA